MSIAKPFEKLDAILFLRQNNKVFLNIKNCQARIIRPRKTLCRKRRVSPISLKLFTIAYEYMCVRPRYAQVICVNAVEEKKSRILFEQTSYEIGNPYSLLHSQGILWVKSKGKTIYCKSAWAINCRKKFT